MGHLLNTDHHRKDEDIVLSRLNRNAVAVSQVEQFLGNLGDFVATVDNCILMVKDIAMDFQVGSMSHTNHEVLHEWSEESFFNHSQLLTIGSLNLHRFLDGEHDFVNFCQLFPVGILKDKVFIQTYFSVYFIDLFRLLILHPIVTANGDHFLAHEIALSTDLLRAVVCLMIIPKFWL